MVESLFNLVDIDADFVDRFINDYYDYLDYSKSDDTYLQFLCYTISRMWEQDLDCNIIIIGRKRSSKSTLGYLIAEYVYAGRKVRFDYKDFVDNYVIYDIRQRNNSKPRKVYLHDESYLTSDRRRSMTKIQVQHSQDLNFYASQNNVNINLIQNFSDLDQRIVDTANILILVTKRGEGMLFISYSTLALIKNTFGFDVFINNEGLAKNSPVASQLLRSKTEYVCDLSWPKLDGTAGFEYYKKNKEAWQEKRRKGFKAERKERTSSPEAIAKKNKIIELRKTHPEWRQEDIGKEVGVSFTYVNQVLKGKR